MNLEDFDTNSTTNVEELVSVIGPNDMSFPHSSLLFKALVSLSEINKNFKKFPCKLEINFQSQAQTKLPTFKQFNIVSEVARDFADH